MSRAHLIEEVKQLELAADAAMVAPPGFFELVLVGRQFLRRLEERPIDALQLRILLAAAPVGSGDAHELERRNLARVIDVPAAAQVGKLQRAYTA